MFFAGVQHKSTDVNYSLRICDVKNAYASEGSMNWALCAQTNTCSLKYHNIVNTSCPLSVQLHPPAIGRTRHQLHYLPIQASRDSFKLSFFICTIPTWNRPVSDSTIVQGLSGHGPSSGERHASHHHPSLALRWWGCFYSHLVKYCTFTTEQHEHPSYTTPWTSSSFLGVYPYSMKAVQTHEWW